MVLLNIDMPSCCSECPLFDDRWDYPTCYATGSSRGYNFKIRELRMPDCPLSNDFKGTKDAAWESGFKSGFNVAKDKYIPMKITGVDYHTLLDMFQEEYGKLYVKQYAENIGNYAETKDIRGFENNDLP